MKKFGRVSLRSMLILMLLICFGLAVYPRTAIRQYSRQSKAEEILASSNFRLEQRKLEHNFYSLFLKLFIPAEDLHQVVTANGASRNIKDDDLRPLGDLPWLEKLYLSNTPVSDTGMPFLDQCHELRRVSLWSTQVTDDGLAVFADKQELEVFDIGNPYTCSGNSRATRECLKHFANLPRLKVFKFSFPIEACDLSLLETMPRFAPERLTIDKATDTAIYRVTQWQSLKYLSLTDGQFISLAPLQWLPNLTELWISGTKIKDQHLAGLTACGQLKSISLRQTSTTNQSLPDLMEMPTLETLRTDFWGTDVTWNEIPCDIHRARQMSKSVAKRFHHNCCVTADELESLAKSNLMSAEHLTITDLSNDDPPAGITRKRDSKPFDNKSLGAFIANSKCENLTIRSKNVDLGCMSYLKPDSAIRNVQLVREWGPHEPFTSTTVPCVKKLEGHGYELSLQFSPNESLDPIRIITISLPSNWEGKKVRRRLDSEVFPQPP